jgi:TRAP-type C4-dicarboxylate transport system permease small subunit
MATAIRWFGRLLEAVTIIGLVLTLAAALTGIVDRFILHKGLTWSEELARFALIWTSLLAVAIAIDRRQHFALTLVPNMIGRTGRRVLDLVVLLCLGAMAWTGFQLTSLFSGMTSPALDISMAWVYGAVPVAALASSVYVVRDLITGIDPLAPATAGDVA